MANPLYYFHDSNQPLGIDNSTWMKKLDNRLYLSQISIPGTHESMSVHGDLDIGKCQVLVLPYQLQAGIRYLDIRCNYVTDGTDNMSEAFKIYHGPIFEENTFGNVLTDVTKFLQNNPSETILMRIQQEHSSQANPTFTRVMNAYISQYKSFFWDRSTLQGGNTPRLQDVRGKIVVLYHISDHSIGLPYPNALDIQDQYDLTTNWDLYSKWTAVENHLDKANQQFQTTNQKPENIPQSPIILNHLSGNYGSYPYFVASGHASNGTHAGRLWTGLTTLTSRHKYPDFPRINCLGKLCSIYFEGMNIMCGSRLNNYQFAGIIAADFPGPDLINNVIQLNFDHQPTLIDITPPPTQPIPSTNVATGDTDIWNKQTSHYTSDAIGMQISINGRGDLKFYKNSQLVKTIEIHPLFSTGDIEDTQTYQTYMVSLDFDKVSVSMGEAGTIEGGTLYFTVVPPWGQQPSSSTDSFTTNIQKPLQEKPNLTYIYELWYDPYAVLAQKAVIQGSISLSEKLDTIQDTVAIYFRAFNNNKLVWQRWITITANSKFENNTIPILFLMDQAFDEIRMVIVPSNKQADSSVIESIKLNGTVYYQADQVPLEMFDLPIGGYGGGSPADDYAQQVWNSPPGKLGTQITYTSHSPDVTEDISNPQISISCFKSEKLIIQITETAQYFQRIRTPIHVPEGFDKVIIQTVLPALKWRISGKIDLQDIDTFTNDLIYPLQNNSYSTTTYTTIWKATTQMDVSGVSAILFLENTNSIPIIIECLKDGESVYQSDSTTDSNPFITLGTDTEAPSLIFDEIRIISTSNQLATGSIVGSVESIPNTTPLQTPCINPDFSGNVSILYPQDGDTPLSSLPGMNPPEPDQLAYEAIIYSCSENMEQFAGTLSFWKDSILVKELPVTLSTDDPVIFQIPEGFNKISVDFNDLDPTDPFDMGIQGQIFFGINQRENGSGITLSSPKTITLQTSNDLERISTLVHQLFASTTHMELATKVTDYEIEQVLLQVEQLSDVLFSKEKQPLLVAVKKAKRLSVQRNLLQHGAFENKNSWIVSPYTNISSKHELFKNACLELYATPHSNPSPTYAYQHISKRKLKPYTCYLVRGVVEESSSLELLLSCDSISSRYHLNIQKGGSIDTHSFAYSIHTGSLQYNPDVGLELCFKLDNPNSKAVIGNVEVIEARALNTSERKWMQRKETKWYKNWHPKQKSIQEKLDAVHQNISSLFELDASLHLDVTHQDIQELQIPSPILLDGIYHSMMPDQPGPYYKDYSQLIALQLYARKLAKNRNLLSSGTFQYYLQDWNIEGNVTINSAGIQPFLHVVGWESVASQTLRLDYVDENNEEILYYLCVHAEGNGHMSLKHGDKIDTLAFHTEGDKQTKILKWFPTKEIVELEVTADVYDFKVYSIEIFKCPLKE
ncbi:phosphatidylinositol-specific phospholipase C domain-containing protein, partial [Bacillus cereus]